MTPAPDHIDAARMIRFPTAWARIWHDYDLLTISGVPDLEALRLATDTEADRRAQLPSLSTRAVVRSLHEALTAERNML